MFLIIGLGNPGKKYEKTRHNAGFIIIDQLVKQFNISNSWQQDTKSNALILKKQNIIFAKPQTMMNDSGLSVGALTNYYKIKSSQTIIIYDELDLPFGKIRIRARGRSAGHNGLKSIIEHLHTENFWHIRLGIANEKKDTIPAEKFVLQKFSCAEYKQLTQNIFAQLLNEIQKILKS